MKLRSRLVVIGLLPLLAIAAASPTDWLRAGNIAFSEGDYPMALACYAKAEERTSDPGQVAFNKAAALYQLGDYQAAAEEYARSLEDAAGPRRVRSMYGRGNSLVQLGRSRRGALAVQTFEEAIESYRSCLALEASLNPVDREACEATFAHARDNLRIAEQWLEKKRAEAADEPPPMGPDNGGSTNTRTDPGTRPDMERRDPRTGNTQAPSEGSPQTTNERRPGRGNLPLLLDDVNTTALDQDTAAEYLQRTLERLHRARADRRPPGSLDPNFVRDW